MRRRPGPVVPAAARLAGVLLATLLAAGPGAGCRAGTAGGTTGHAVILLYHHVAEDTPPSTSVSPATFAMHLDHLAEHGYRVVPLSRIVTALRGDGEPLPERAVAITFDDAYRSVYTQAAPRLERAGHPYTVFVSTDYIDQGLDGYLGWEALRELEQAGAEIGNHSRDHGHYVHRRPEESADAWRQRIAGDIDSAQARLEQELARPLRALAYPYGEFDPALTRLAAELGFVAFGQQSGPVGPGSDLQALPRFPMAGPYAGLDSLAEKLRTRPLQVTVLNGPGPVLAPDAPAPTLRLRLGTGPVGSATDPDPAGGPRLDAIACFVTGQSRPRVAWADRGRAVLEVTAQQPLPVGRSKYTCTAPARSAAGVFYWYSHLWMKPPAPGAWYPD